MHARKCTRAHTQKKKPHLHFSADNFHTSAIVARCHVTSDTNQDTLSSGSLLLHAFCFIPVGALANSGEMQLTGNVDAEPLNATLYACLDTLSRESAML